MSQEAYDPEADDPDWQLYNQGPAEQPKVKGFGVQVRKPKSLNEMLGERLEYGLPEDGEGKTGKKVKAPCHNARTFKYLQDRGLTPTKEEHWVLLRNGFGIKVDKYGLFDFSFRDPDPSKPLGYVQSVTGEKGLQVHMRNMTSNKIAFDNKRPRLENLLWCLDQGYYIGILVFDKAPNGRNWDKRMVRVTREMVQGYLGRKRHTRPPVDFHPST